MVAEYLLRLLPQGAHDWNKFITPDELKSMLSDGKSYFMNIFNTFAFIIYFPVNCSTRLIHGMMYIPFKNEWYWCPDSSINYALHAVKNKDDVYKESSSTKVVFQDFSEPPKY